MNRWIGRTLVVIGVIHSLVGFVFLRSTIVEIIDAGVVATVQGQPLREATFWFLFFGFLVILLGLLIDWLEMRGLTPPLPFAAGFLAMAVVAVAIMPISGWWLVFLPAVSLVLRALRSATTATVRA